MSVNFQPIETSHSRRQFLGAASKAFLGGIVALPLTSGLVEASSSEPTQDKEKLRKLALENRYNPSVVGLVSNPNNYKIDKKDIELAISEPNTYFALGVGRNPLTIELMIKDKEIQETTSRFFKGNLDNAFTIGLSMNEFPITNEVQELCRKNPQKQITYFLTKKSTYSVSEVDRKIARANYKSPFAQGVVQNDGYVPKGQFVPKEDKEIVWKDPISNFAADIVKKPTYKVEKEDKEVARNNVEAQFVFYLTEKPDYKVGRNDILTARNNLNSWFCHIASNPNYVKGTEQEVDGIDVPIDIQKDIEIGIKNPDTIFAEELFANPALKLTPELVDLVKSDKYKDTLLANGMVQNPNYPMNEENIKFAKANLNAWFAAGLAFHPDFPMTKENVKFGMANPYSRYAYGLASNPKFPITKEALELAWRDLRSYFAFGLREHPEYEKAIRALNVTVDEVTDATFEANVLKSTKPVLVDFWAPWCGPCKKVAPIVKEIAQDYVDKLKVVKLNVDENEETSRAYKIDALPCLVLFKDGKEVDRIVGSVTKSKISSLVEDVFK